MADHPPRTDPAPADERSPPAGGGNAGSQTDNTRRAEGTSGHEDNTAASTGSADGNGTNGTNTTGDSDPRSEARSAFNDQDLTQHEIIEKLYDDGDRNVAEEHFIETKVGVLRYNITPLSQDWLSDIRQAAPDGTERLYEAYAEKYREEHDGEDPDRKQVEKSDLKATLRDDDVDISESDLRLDGEGRKVFEDGAVASLESAPAPDDPTGAIPVEDTRNVVVGNMSEIMLNNLIDRVIELSDASEAITGFR